MLLLSSVSKTLVPAAAIAANEDEEGVVIQVAVHHRETERKVRNVLCALFVVGWSLCAYKYSFVDDSFWCIVQFLFYSTYST